MILFLDFPIYAVTRPAKQLLCSQVSVASMKSCLFTTKFSQDRQFITAPSRQRVELRINIHTQIHPQAISWQISSAVIHRFIATALFRKLKTCQAIFRRTVGQFECWQYILITVAMMLLNALRNELAKTITMKFEIIITLMISIWEYNNKAVWEDAVPMPGLFVLIRDVFLHEL